MTKSEIFKAAHKLAKETKDFAGSYRVAFSQALKTLYKKDELQSIVNKLAKAPVDFKFAITKYTQWHKGVAIKLFIFAGFVARAEEKYPEMSGYDAALAYTKAINYAC